MTIDWIKNRRNVARIRNVVVKYYTALIAQLKAQNNDVQSETESHDSDTQSQIISSSSEGDIIKGFVMGYDEFQLLRPKLPFWYDGYKIIIDLDDGFLNVRVVPGDIHGAAAAAWTVDIQMWSRNGVANPFGTIPPLRERQDASKTSAYF